MRKSLVLLLASLTLALGLCPAFAFADSGALKAAGEVNTEADAPGEAIVAPLADHTSGVETDVTAASGVSVEQTNKSATEATVKYTATSLMRHNNTDSTFAYWAGIGVPYKQTDGYSFKAGWDLDSLTVDANPISYGDYTTFYFGTRSASLSTKTGYVQVLKNNEAVATYTIDFSGVTCKNATVKFVSNAHGTVAAPTMKGFTYGQELSANDIPQVTPDQYYQLKDWCVSYNGKTDTVTNLAEYKLPSETDANNGVITITANFAGKAYDVTYVAVKETGTDTNVYKEVARETVEGLEYGSRLFAPIPQFEAYETPSEEPTDAFFYTTLKNNGTLDGGIAHANATVSGTQTVYFVVTNAREYTMQFATGDVPSNVATAARNQGTTEAKKLDPQTIAYDSKSTTEQATKEIDGVAQPVWKDGSGKEYYGKYDPSDAKKFDYTGLVGEKPAYGTVLEKVFVENQYVMPTLDPIGVKADGETVTTNPEEIEYYYVVEGWYPAYNTGTKKYSGEKQDPGAKLDSKFLGKDNTDANDTATYYAKWAKKWKVTFENDNLGTMKAKDKVVYVDAVYDDDGYGIDTEVTTPAAPENATGYDFKGWKNGKTVVAAATKTTVSGNTEFVADWARKQITVKFVTGTSQKIQDQTIEYGSPVDLPTSLKADEKTGYEFKVTDADNGWYTDEACKTMFDNTKPVSADTILYAKWTPIKYKVYLVNGGTTSSGTISTYTEFTYDNKDSKTLTAWDKLGLVVPDSEKAQGNNDFVGWAKAKVVDGQYVAVDDEIAYTDEASLDDYLVKTATANANKAVALVALYGKAYTVTFNANFPEDAIDKTYAKKVSERNLPTQKFVSGKASPLKAYDPKKFFSCTNYTFKEWNTQADGNGTVYADGADYSNVKSSDTVLYAIWQGKTYTVMYDVNGGTGTAPESQVLTVGDMEQAKNQQGKYGWVYKYDTSKIVYEFAKPSDDYVPYMVAKTVKTAAKPTNLTKDGYQLVGWNTKANGQGTHFGFEEAIATSTLEENVTLYAEWSVGVYTLDFKTNLFTGTGTLTPKYAVATGMSDAAAQIAGYAQTAPVITYNDGEGVYLPEVPYVREGYTADGWVVLKQDALGEWVEYKTYAEKATIGTTDLVSNVRVDVNWVGKDYPVKFVSNDGAEVIASYNVRLDKAPTFSVIPTKEATDELEYEFVAWAYAKGATAQSENLLWYNKEDGKFYSDSDFVATNLIDMSAITTKTIATNNGGTVLDDMIAGKDSAKLYAVFVSQPRKYDVTFDASGVSATGMPPADKVAYGNGVSDAAKSAKPTAEGYTFGGWFTDSAYATAADLATFKITGETTFYAKFIVTDEAIAKAAVDAAKAAAADANLPAADKATLEAAIKAFNDKAEKTSADVAALNAATEAAKKAAADAKAEAEKKAAEKAASDALAAAQAQLKDATMPADAKAALEAAIAEFEKSAKDEAAVAKLNAATEAAKAAAGKQAADDALVAANKVLADKNLPAADKAELQKAIDKFNASAKDAKAVKALTDATAKAKKAADAAAKKMTVKQNVKKIKATKGKKTATKNVFAVSDAQGTVKVTVAKKFKKFVKAKANGKVIVTKKAKKGGKVKITITDGKTKQTIKVKVKLAKKK